MAKTKNRSSSKSGSKRGSNKSASPYVSAAIATGAVTAVAAAAAGAWFFRNSDKSFSETADDLGERIKDGIADARLKAGTKARSFKDKAAMFFADEPESQTAVAEEAMQLKRSGRKTRRPIDDTIESELKTGAVSY